jgi:hypothetical protein
MSLLLQNDIKATVLCHFYLKMMSEIAEIACSLVWRGLDSHSLNDWAFYGSALARVRLVASDPGGVSIVTEAALHGDVTSP